MKTKEFFEDMQEELNKYLEERGVVITAANIDQYEEKDFAEIRHTGFGASDSSKILGVNPFPNGTIEDLLNEKVNKITDDTIGAKATVRMGKELESFIIDKFEREVSKYTLVPFNVLKPVHMYGKKEIGLNTNFDGVIFEWGKFIPMEVKTISAWGRKHYNFKNALDITPNESDDITRDFLAMAPIEPTPALETVEDTILERAKKCGIPPYYYTQLQQQIDFLVAPHGYLLVLDVNDWTIRIYKVLSDELVISTLNQRAKNLFLKLQIATGTTTIVDDGEDI